MTEQRLTDLEIKISHQVVAIEELQQVVFDQHTAIKKLEKSLALFTERLGAMAAQNPEIGPGNEKPPHY